MIITPTLAPSLSISDVARPAEVPLAPQADPAPGAGSFETVLSDALGQVSEMGRAAQQKMDALAAGTIDDLHGTMISMKEADIALRLVGTVRNKILDAFQELWRTSV